ncbi:MAG: fibronectin type III domain-containing protein [Nitrospira sp.]|nr:fibronectin type III domain-containing protein [Nitrospira sp.]
MLLLRPLAGSVSWQSNISMVLTTLLVLLLMSVAGCADDGGRGPMVSSLSTPTDATAESDSDQAHHSALADSDGEEDPTITMTSSPTGVTAHVTWVPPPNMNVAGYNIYYRQQPSVEPSSEESASEESSSEASVSEEPSLEEQSSCSSGESQTVEAPAATITGLEPNTRYSFAIRAFNESESLCSNEITAMTPSAQS